MSCPTQTITLTRAEFEAAATKARQLQDVLIDTTQTSGTICVDKVTAAWAYAEPILTLTVTEKPFYMPCAMLESAMKEFFS